MLIPYGTDAPIYHLPYATVGMIVLNAIVSFAAWTMTGGGWYLATDELGQTVWIVEEMILQYGHGLRPWQWISSNFLHGDIIHLLGNMFCLWGFGLVAEGKIGWQRFLLIYFGIGVAQCGIEQTCMLFASQGGSLGASAIIFGLLAICMVWAPQNEMSCVMFITLRPIVFEASLYAIATVALLIELGTGMLAGLSVTSQALHLMGAAAGFAIGVVMVKRDWVDCEGWDLFSVWAGKDFSARFDAKDAEDAAAAALIQQAQEKRLAARVDEQGPQSAPARTVPAVDPLLSPPLQVEAPPESVELTALRAAIAAANPARAYVLFQQIADDPLNWPLPEKELIQTIALFHKQSLWTDSIPAMVTYLRNFTAQDAKVRLKLAHILIDAARRPRQALRVLETLHAPLLSDQEAGMLQKLTERAQSVMGTADEPPVEDW